MARASHRARQVSDRSRLHVTPAERFVHDFCAAKTHSTTQPSQTYITVVSPHTIPVGGSLRDSPAGEEHVNSRAPFALSNGGSGGGHRRRSAAVRHAHSRSRRARESARLATHPAPPKAATAQDLASGRKWALPALGTGSFWQLPVHEALRRLETETSARLAAQARVHGRQA